MNLYTATITLFLVMNPLGNIPVFIATLKHLDPKKRSKIILREAIFAFLILIVFLFAGNYILEGLHVTASALSIAGGIILFLIAIKFIFPEDKEKPVKVESEPFLVPLAIPLFAGPATMAMLMVLTEQQPHKFATIFLALVIAWTLASSLLLSSNIISNILGKRGLTALERLMGMLLTTIAVQMFLSGIQGYFHTYLL